MWRRSKSLRGRTQKQNQEAGRQEEEVGQTKKRKERDVGNEMGTKDGQIKVRKTTDREMANMDDNRTMADAEESPQHCTA